VEPQLVIGLDPAPVGEAGGVAQAHAGGDPRVARVVAQAPEIRMPGLLAALALPQRLVHVRLQRGVEVDHALLAELHHEDGEHRLAERRAVELGVGPQRLACRLARVAEGARVDRLGVVEHGDGEPRDLGRRRQRVDPIRQRGSGDRAPVQTMDLAALRPRLGRRDTHEDDRQAGKRGLAGDRLHPSCLCHPPLW
jgi:hypothetical protein